MFHIFLYCRVYLCSGKVAAYTNAFCHEQGNITGCYFEDVLVQYKSCGKKCNGSEVLSKIIKKCDELCPG